MKEMWKKIRKSLKNLDFVLACLQTAWNVCCILGGALIVGFNLVSDVRSFYYDFISTEQLQSVHIHLFDIRFITDQAEHIFANWLTRSIAVLLAVGLIICLIFLFLGQNADDESGKSEKDETNRSNQRKPLPEWAVTVCVMLFIYYTHIMRLFFYDAQMTIKFCIIIAVTALLCFGSVWLSKRLRKK